MLTLMSLTSVVCPRFSASINSRWLTGNVTYIGVLADDERQHAAVRADDIALRHVGAADPSRDRRGDVRVTEIDLRRLQVGLVGQNRAVGLLVRGPGLVSRHLGAGLRLQQRFGTIQLERGQHLGGLAALQRPLRLFDGGLEQPLLDAVKRRAFLDDITFLETHILQKALHARNDLDAIDGFHTADKINSVGNRFALRRNGADRNRGGRGLLCGRRCGKGANHHGREKSHAHRRVPSMRPAAEYAHAQVTASRLISA